MCRLSVWEGSPVCLSTTLLAKCSYQPSFGVINIVLSLLPPWCPWDRDSMKHSGTPWKTKKIIMKWLTFTVLSVLYHCQSSNSSDFCYLSSLRTLWGSVGQQGVFRSILPSQQLFNKQWINPHVLVIFQCTDVLAKVHFVCCLRGVIFWVVVVSKGRKKLRKDSHSRNVGRWLQIVIEGLRHKMMCCKILQNLFFIKVTTESQTFTVDLTLVVQSTATEHQEVFL